MSDLGTWIGVVIGVAALVFAVLGYLNRLAHARIEYVVTVSRRILPGRVADDLEVAHRGVVLADPALSVVRIVNTGDRAIRTEDFETPLSVTFGAVRELVSASWSATRPEDLRPGIGIDSNRVSIAPNVINPGDMLELQVLSAGPPSGVSLAGRVADLVVIRREGLPYPPGSGTEGEMLSFDRFIWFVLSPALIIGVGLLIALRGEASETGHALVFAGTSLALAAYFIQTMYLVRRRRRWCP
jgi:hypothetical protein